MDSSNLTFRKATSNDVAALEALVNLAYRGGEATVAWKNEHHLVTGARVTHEELVEALQNSVILLAVTADGGVVGCVQIETEGSEAVIGMLSVNPKFQNFGLGRRLLNEAATFAKNEQNCSVGKMFVLCGRPELMAWYAKCGYEPTGERKPFFGPETRLTALVDDAHFVVVSKKL